MPEVNEHIKQVNEALAEKVNALGADTIMGAMQNVGDDYQDKVEKLQDAVAETKEAEETAKGAITGETLEAMAKAGYFRKTRPIVRDNKKIGRNDPCPCGSRKKFKNCCMNTGRYDTTHFE